MGRLTELTNLHGQPASRAASVKMDWSQEILSIWVVLVKFLHGHYTGT